MRLCALCLSCLMLVWLSGCAGAQAFPQSAPPITYEVIAEGAPPVASETSPQALVVHSEELPNEVEGLPAEAREALEAAQIEAPEAVYLVLYGGQQPSGGHRVELVSLERGAGNDLEVTYRVVGPAPGEGAAAVLTYPYLILRVDAPGIDPAEVCFVEE